MFFFNGILWDGYGLLWEEYVISWVSMGFYWMNNGMNNRILLGFVDFMMVDLMGLHWDFIGISTHFNGILWDEYGMNMGFHGIS